MAFSNGIGNWTRRAINREAIVALLVVFQEVIGIGWVGVIYRVERMAIGDKEDVMGRLLITVEPHNLFRDFMVDF